MRQVARVELHCGLRVERHGGEIGGGGQPGWWASRDPPGTGTDFPLRVGEQEPLLGPGSEADQMVGMR